MHASAVFAKHWYVPTEGPINRSFFTVGQQCFANPQTFRNVEKACSVYLCWWQKFSTTLRDSSALFCSTQNSCSEIFSGQVECRFEKFTGNILPEKPNLFAQGTKKTGNSFSQLRFLFPQDVPLDAKIQLSTTRWKSSDKIPISVCSFPENLMNIYSQKNKLSICPSGHAECSFADFAGKFSIVGENLTLNMQKWTFLIYSKLTNFSSKCFFQHNQRGFDIPPKKFRPTTEKIFRNGRRKLKNGLIFREKFPQIVLWTRKMNIWYPCEIFYPEGRSFPVSVQICWRKKPFFLENFLQMVPPER